MKYDPLYRADPRSFWKPYMSRVYGIQPWHMIDLAEYELVSLVDDMTALNEAQSSG